MMPSMSLVRREFESGDHTLARMLDKPVYDSWQRCSAKQMPMQGNVEYGFLSDDQLKDTLLYRKPLLDGSRHHLDALYRSIGGAGWSVLLTDRHCNALRVYQSRNVAEQRIMQAFRQGAVLSEALIGTSAMSCAIESQRFVSVYGEEHYKAYHRDFNCAAVPVYDPLGAVCASVDITNESPLKDHGAFYLLEVCARNIQIELIRSIPDAIVIRLYSGNEPLGADHLVLAFAYDQTLVGANVIAQRFFKLNLQSEQVRFDTLFDEPFSILFDQGLLKSNRFSLDLVGGISLHGEVLDLPGSERARSVVSIPVAAGAKTPVGKRPCFGDPRIESAVDKSLKAIERLPVLLSGESGVGKEVVAQLIHDSSPAGKGEFVSLNCASIPESLIESELFGYERGAFTGASREGRIGKVQQANGGTLFLDEIGEMPLALQTRLLRVLETREVVKLGATKAEQIRFQLICATNKNLDDAIQTGEFRKDLLYRINGYEMRIPPLRERPDILGIAGNILREVSGGHRQFGSSALECITRYAWPGNVRELRNAIVYADTLVDSGRAIEAADLPQYLRPSDDSMPIIDGARDGTLKAACDGAIQEAIEKCDGNMTQAARYLGIGRATLYRRLAKGC